MGSRDVDGRGDSASSSTTGTRRSAPEEVAPFALHGLPTVLRHPGPIVDLLSVAIGVFDRDMAVVWLNQAMLDVFHLDPENVDGRCWFDLVPPMAERRAIYERTLAGVSQIVEETAVPFPDGTRYFDVRYDPLRDEHGSVVGMIAAGQEVTRRAQLKQQLQERMHELQRTNAELQLALERHQETDRILTRQKNFLESVLDNIPVILILYDDEGRVQLINTECQRALGWSLADWREREPLAYCYPEPDVRLSVEEFMSQSSVRWNDFKTRTRAGREIDVAWCSVRLSTGGRIGIGQDVTERRQSEREILEIERTLQQRIGRDLHDDLGQSLVAIGYMLDQLHTQLASEGHPRQTDLRRIRQHVLDTMDQTRTLARDLSPVTLVANNLQASLEELASRVESMFDVTCTVRARGKVRAPDAEAGNHLYRIAQEAISNAIRHGGARRVEVLLDGRDAQLCLEIRDDGTGLPDVVDDSQSLGLRLMKHRASVIGATLEIRNTKSRGCQVRIRLAAPRRAP